MTADQVLVAIAGVLTSIAGSLASALATGKANTTKLEALERRLSTLEAGDHSDTFRQRVHNIVRSTVRDAVARTTLRPDLADKIAALEKTTAKFSLEFADHLRDEAERDVELAKALGTIEGHLSAIREARSSR